MDWLGFALAVLLVEITPGPNMAWLVSLTLASGRRAGLAAVAGIAIGLALNAGLSSVGLSTLLMNFPAIGGWISMAAGVMMLWLAWQGWREDGESSLSAVDARSPRRYLFAGIAINLFNAKAAIFFITIVPQFLSGPDAGFREIAMLGLISVGVATLIHVGLVLSAGGFRRHLTGRDTMRPIRRVLAFAMVAVGCWFFYSAFQ